MVELKVSQELLTEVQQAVAAHQPELNITTTDNIIILDGLFVVSGPQGPFDSYQVKVDILANFPFDEPVILEIGGRIPKENDRHISKDGSCCLGVWEEWLLTAPDNTFETFLTGIMHDYFLSQTCFEAKGEWPFGERPHGNAGVVESFSELLGIEAGITIIMRYLRLLSMGELKGHHPCPCGSDRKLRQCHKDKLENLKERISPHMAMRMLKRVSPNKHGNRT